MISVAKNCDACMNCTLDYMASYRCTNWAHEADDPLFKQARVNIVGPFTPTGLFDYDGNHGGSMGLGGA